MVKSSQGAPSSRPPSSRPPPVHAHSLSDCGLSIQQLALFLAQTKKVDPRPQFLDAKKILERAIALKPEQALPHARIAVIYFYPQDCKNLLREVAIAQKLGGEGLEPRFIKDLNAACPA